MPRQGGPHLQAALFCERAIEEKDGTLSLIRVVDRIYVRILGFNPKSNEVDELPSLPAGVQVETAVAELTAVVMLKSGGYQGPAEVVIRAHDPRGKSQTLPAMSAYLQGGENGINIRYQLYLELGPDSIGLHWYDVSVNGKRLTRMPLRVALEPTNTARPEAAKE
jgi:hypothetical protein